MATIKDVAALAGISYTTVSHVVNKTRPVSEPVRIKVEAAIKQLETLAAEVGVTFFPSDISQQPVAELGIIGMGVEDRVGQIGLIEVPVGDRAGEPAVVRLAGELQDPARDRDGDPVAGQLTNERVHHFPGRFACDKYAAARRNTSTSCSSNRIRFRASRSSAASVRDWPGLVPSSTSARRIHFVSVIG